MFMCIVLYNVAHKLPIVKYYSELKILAITEDKQVQDPPSSVWRKTLKDVVERVKWYGFGILLIYIMTLSIFPGYITEDVSSKVLNDWYPILLIACFNVFDLVGRSLTSLYLLENPKIAVGCCIARLLFFPLFFVCLHGPGFFGREIPVTILTGLLGLTNGYLTNVLMILAPKVVRLQNVEAAGTVMVLFLVVDLSIGSVLAWFWVI